MTDKQSIEKQRYLCALEVALKRENWQQATAILEKLIALSDTLDEGQEG